MIGLTIVMIGVAVLLFIMACALDEIGDLLKAISGDMKRIAKALEAKEKK